MINGLRAADAPLIQRLVNGDLKVLLRLGALLQDGYAVSEAALQSLATDGNLRLLLDRRLKGCDEQGFDALCQELGIPDLTLATARDGVRVIALSDEVGNPFASALLPEPEPEPAEATGLSAVVATLSPTLRTPVEGFLAARADDQRAAALEQLRYAMPPLPVVCELMPMLLADGAEVVRERSIALLVASGAHIAVIDTIRALQRGDDDSLGRFAETLSRLQRPQQELALSAVVAHLARGQATPGIVQLARALAPLLAGHRSLERLVELLLPRHVSLIALVRALQDHDRGRIDAILARNLGISAEQDAQLIILLAAPTAPGPDHPLDLSALLARGCQLLISPDATPRERMALAAALRRLDTFQPQPTLARDLAAAGMALGKAFDTSVYWLLAELCRDGVVDAATAEQLAGLCRRILRDGNGPHLIAMLEQQLPALLPASLVAKGNLVEPVLETVARFHDDRSRDVVIACVLALGTTALPSLWAALHDHPRTEVRLLCAELLPDLVALSGDPAVGHDAIDRLLSQLARTEDTTERTALTTAAARIATGPGLRQDLDTHARVLSATNGLGNHGMEALGFLAASPSCPDETREDLLTRMLHALSEEVPDSPVETSIDPASQEVTFLLDDALTRHTDTLPLVMHALERIGSAADLPPGIAKLVMERLCRQWKEVSNWRVVWGPGNIRELGETIARLAERDTCAPPLRVQAAEALLNGANQLSIARALARVFIAGSGTYLGTLAGRAAARLVQLASDDYYADDERPDLVEVLVDFLAVPQLGREDLPLRRRMVNLISTLNTHLTARARLRLRYLRNELDPSLLPLLEWA
jgi:hypothetical protein